MARGDLARWLEARGWKRTDWFEGLGPAADFVPHCGAISDDPKGTGECYHPRNWSKPGQPWWGEHCAQHARQVQLSEDAREHAAGREKKLPGSP